MESETIEAAEFGTAIRDVVEDMIRNDVEACALRERQQVDTPRMSITGGSNTIKVTVGIDWLKVFVYSDDLVPEPIRRGIRTAKERSQDNYERETVQFGEELIEVRPSGFGNGKMRMEYVFDACEGDVTVGLSSKDDEGYPRAMIEIRGAACTGLAPQTVMQQVAYWAALIGMGHAEMRLSRVDVAIDVFGRHVRQVEVQRRLGGITVKSRKAAAWFPDGDVSGVRFGVQGGMTHLMAYDKATEMETDSKKKAAFESAHGRFDGDVTRYEFHLNRDGLQQNHDLSTLCDLRCKFGSLVRYLTHTWYRETEPEDWNKQGPRRRCTSFWEAVQRQVLKIPVEQERQRRERRIPEKQGLVQQAAGCLLSAASVMPADCETAIEVIEQTFASLQRCVHEKLAEYRKRHTRWQVWCTENRDRVLQLLERREVRALRKVPPAYPLSWDFPAVNAWPPIGTCD